MIVLDASVAIKLLLPERGSAQALALLEAGPCVAPDLIVNECTNALWKNAKLGRVSPGQAAEAAMIFPGLGIGLIGSASLSARALEIAIALDHAAHDCFYLALAEDRRIELVTADGSFVRKVAASSFHHAPVRLLGSADDH